MVQSNQPVPRPPETGLDVQEKIRLIRDGVINYSGLLVSGVVGLVLVPIMLKGLGQEVYGLWVAAMALVGLAGILDFGLGASVTQAVAAGDKGRDTVSRFVTSAGTGFLVIGVAGGVVVAALGLPLSGALRLSEPARALAPTVFLLAGVFYLFSQVLTYARAVLVGLRRFDAANLLAAAGAILGAGGTIVLLQAGRGLIEVAGWQAASLGAGAAVSLGVIGRLEPRFRFRWLHFDWGTVRERLPFSLTSQLTHAAIRVVWDSPALLIGLVRGSATIVPYHIGQKFPVAASQVGWCAAEALYPAASPEEQAAEMPRMRAILEVGIRWVVVLVLPLAVVLWIVAPTLIETWIGQPQGEAAQVLRIVSAAVLADALGVGALYVLWGRGLVRPVLLVLTGMAMVQLGLGLWLLLRMGVVGVAWAMLVSMALGSIAFLQLAARVCRFSVWTLAREIVRGLPLAALVCVAAALAAERWLPLGGWGKVIGVSLAGGGAYAVSLLVLGGAREEERILAGEAAQLPAAALVWAYRGLRRLLRHVGPLRSAYYFWLVFKEYLHADPIRARRDYEQQYENAVDPYHFDTSPKERERLQSALRMLDDLRGGERFERALEVGCSIGTFTQMLWPRCESLLAVDFSPVALERARRRLESHSQIEFRQVDLIADSLGDGLDLVVCMSVLEGYNHPDLIRRARNQLVESLAPGGYLLFSSVLESEVIENAWWARYFLRGTRWLNGFMAAHPALEPVATQKGDFYVHTLLRKVE